jgi:hypothetical protein
LGGATPIDPLATIHRLTGTQLPVTRVAADRLAAGTRLTTVTRLARAHLAATARLAVTRIATDRRVAVPRLTIARLAVTRVAADRLAAAPLLTIAWLAAPGLVVARLTAVTRLTGGLGIVAGGRRGPRWGGAAADVGTGVLDIRDIAVSTRMITDSARHCRCAVSGLGAAGHEVLSSDYSGQ